MPNWCSNHLSITGKKNTLTRLKNLLDVPGATAISFDKVLPTPQFPDEDNNGPFPAWYNWRLTHWGVKWDVEAYFVDLIPHPETGDASLIYEFDSAWGPPIEFFEYLSKRYKSLHFELTYSEPGIDFWGNLILQNGEELEHVQMSWSEWAISEGWAEDENGILMPG